MTRWLMALAVGVAAAVTSLTGQTQTGAAGRPPARQNTPLIVMSPKAKPAGWSGVHKPHTKIADVLARHKAQADWAETIVEDESLTAQWISLGPGKKTPRRMNGDTREWWIVRSGTLRFTIEGSEPIVAAKGVMVQVPYRGGAAVRGERRTRAQALSGGRDAGAATGLRVRQDSR
jgi:mannose-6-phosphate isomerase-like protein (cupin superfamily)